MSVVGVELSESNRQTIAVKRWGGGEGGEYRLRKGWRREGGVDTVHPKCGKEPGACSVAALRL